MVIPFQPLALVIIALIGVAVALFYKRRAEAEAAKLSDADRKRFQDQFSMGSDRKNMPRHMTALAQATDRVRGAWAGVVMIVLLAIIFNVF